MKKATTSDGYFRETFTYQGKRYSVRAKTERELWRKVDEKKRRLEEGVDVVNENTRVEKWFADYIETYKKPKVQPTTYSDLCGYIKNYIAPEIGSMRLKEVRAVHLQRIMNSVAGRSASMACKLRDLIKGAFRQARIDRVIVYDPSESLVMPETKNGTHRAITADERKHILHVAETHRAGLWVLFMLYTGARPDETRKATWDDVRRNEQKIILHSSKTDFGDRAVPLHPALAPLLTGGEGYIFTQPTTGKPHTKTSMRQMWETFKRAVDKDMGARTFKGAIIPETSVVADDLTPYCLRHTYATDLQTAGIPLNIAKELLGHKEISMTAKIYTHLSDEAFNSAAEKVAIFDRAQRTDKVVSI